eukprot:4786452-Amphidinium_carterae.1
MACACELVQQALPSDPQLVPGQVDLSVRPPDFPKHEEGSVLRAKKATCCSCSFLLDFRVL